MSGLLSEEVLSHIGRQSAPRREIVTRRDIRKYAIATDNRQAKYLDGDVAPPLFHLHLFWDVVPLNELSPMAYPSTRCCPSSRWKKRWQAVSISATTSRFGRGIG